MAPTPATDPFATAALRDAVLRAWCGSPTRFTEDANAEEDLRLGGYADRLFVELAQNAADAAALAGVAGMLRVTVADGELRVANTGAPLDGAGVAALASLRASAKRGGVTVGRFGVGFSAVLAVCTEPRVVSRTGGVRFSESGTAAAVADLPELAEQLSHREGAVPVLRLPWPVDPGEPPPPDGFDTEVRLPLARGVETDALVASFAREADDVLLTLSGLSRIEIAGRVWTRSGSADGVVVIDHAGEESGRWLVHTRSGEFTAEEAATLGIEAAKHPRWTVLWALPVDEAGVPRPRESDVLHAPTATDERLSLPARLIASVPIEPSRRRVLPGPALDAVLRAAAESYPDLVRRIGADHRVELVPAQGFPLSEVDERLRELVLSELRARPWLLPAAAGEDLPGGRAAVLDVDSPGLLELLADVVPDLAAAPACGPRALRSLAPVGARAVPVPDAVDALLGIDRPAAWWRALYDAVQDILDARAVEADALSGLGVRLADGRTVPGARGVLLPDGAHGRAGGLLDLLADAAVAGVRVADPEVAHPLLTRLGARPLDAAELLDSPGLRAAVERSVADAAAGLDVHALAELVLRLVTETGGGFAEDAAWLGALALRSADGDLRRADELLLPGSPLRAVLDPEAVGQDAPLAVLAAAVAERWPADTLAAVGVLDSFVVVTDADPAGPDHELPEERQWWDSLDRSPAAVTAVRDLDLVADECWPAALDLLASRPETWRALTAPGGHTAWWLARFALLAGEPPQHWRLPGCAGLAGLYDPLPDLGVRTDVLVAAGVRDRLAVSDAADAADLLDRLADPAARPTPGVTLRAHAALAALAARPEVDIAALEPPAAVRTLAGTVCAAERACVLDEPWLVEVADAGRLVACAEGAGHLADLLDLPQASEVFTARVVGDGDYAAWSELGAAVAAVELLGLDLPAGGVLLHPELLVQVDAGPRSAVRWWVDDGDGLHAEDSIEGLARALAFALDRWDGRHLVAALLADPEAVTLLA